MTDIEFYADSSCTKVLDDLGFIEINMDREFPFFIKNIGSEVLYDINIVNNFKDSEIFIEVPNYLKQNEIIKGTLKCNPQKTGKLVGSILIKAKKIGAII